MPTPNGAHKYFLFLKRGIIFSYIGFVDHFVSSGLRAFGDSYAEGGKVGSCGVYRPLAFS